MRTADDAPYRPGRREFISLGVSAFVLAALPFRARAAHTVRRSVPIMGTIADLTVVHPDRLGAHAAIDDALAALRAVDAGMSRFRPDSDVGRANLLALRGRVPVSDATADVVGAALRWADATGGRFDPCLGRVAALWDVRHRTAPPADAELRMLARAGRWTDLELDDAAGAAALRFHGADLALDLGGIAKGYGVDRAVDALRRHGVEHALVNVGGDLYALGRSPDGDPWQIGVRAAAAPHQLAGTIALTDAAVATSGDYEQFFTHGGRIYHHLLDPATAAPRASSLHSVTVQAASCTSADAAATAAFGLSATDADALVRRADVSARVLHLGRA